MHLLGTHGGKKAAITSCIHSKLMSNLSSILVNCVPAPQRASPRPSSFYGAFGGLRVSSGKPCAFSRDHIPMSLLRLKYRGFYRPNEKIRSLIGM
jgi:hypothetical protein